VCTSEKVKAMDCVRSVKGGIGYVFSTDGKTRVGFSLRGRPGRQSLMRDARL